MAGCITLHQNMQYCTHECQVGARIHVHIFIACFVKKKVKEEMPIVIIVT